MIKRPIYVIAEDIANHWPTVSPHARPYLDAMYSLTTTDERYGYDDAKSIIRYFLANASTWRGEDARRIKHELMGLV